MTKYDTLFSVTLSGGHRTVSFLPQVSAHRVAYRSVRPFLLPRLLITLGFGVQGSFSSHSPSRLTGEACLPSCLVART